jgi:hypothetical protein
MAADCVCKTDCLVGGVARVDCLSGLLDASGLRKSLATLTQTCSSDLSLTLSKLSYMLIIVCGGSSLWFFSG